MGFASEGLFLRFIVFASWPEVCFAVFASSIRLSTLWKFVRDLSDSAAGVCRFFGPDFQNLAIWA